jgi:hypothetical protein
MELRRREWRRSRRGVERSWADFVGELFVVSSGEDAAKNTTHGKETGTVTSLLPANPQTPHRCWSLRPTSYDSRSSDL